MRAADRTAVFVLWLDSLEQGSVHTSPAACQRPAKLKPRLLCACCACRCAGDEHVAHSPYPLRVLPARPCMRRSQVSGPGRSAALAGSPAHFTVAACDEFGNR